MDDTHIILKKILSQEFTDHLNSVNDDIKWVTKGEVVLEVPVEGNAMDGEEDASLMVARALVFLDTWMMVESDGTIRTCTKVFRKDTNVNEYLNHWL